MTVARPTRSTRPRRRGAIFIAAMWVLIALVGVAIALVLNWVERWLIPWRRS